MKFIVLNIQDFRVELYKPSIYDVSNWNIKQTIRWPTPTDTSSWKIPIQKSPKAGHALFGI